MSNILSDLWLAFLDGDEDAFSVFYKTSYNMMYSYGKRLKMDDLLIHDTIHDIFLKLYTKPDLIKDVSTLRAFLLTSLRYAFFNQLEKEKRHVYLDKLPYFDLQYSINTDNLEEKDDNEELSYKISQILSHLTPREKEIIYLRFIYQMEYDEISSMLNMTYGGTRNLISKTIKKLREQNNLISMVHLYALFTNLQ